MTKDVARKVMTDKAMWIAVSELVLISLGFLETLPAALLGAFVILIYVSITTSFKTSSLQDLLFKQRVSGEKINYEEELAIEETVKNKGSRPIFLEVLTELPDEIMIGQGSNHYIVYLRGGETRRLRYKVKPSFMGHFTVQRASIRCMDFFLARPDEGKKDLETEFSVVPPLEEFRKFPARRINVKPLHGSIPSKSPGVGADFFEIREYTPSDEFRKINWKASARAGALLSNEYEWERTADIYMILDSTGSSAYFLNDYIRACVSIGNYFLKLGNRVGLLTIGKFWTWVRPGSGRKQLIRLVENLIDQRSGEPAMLSLQFENILRAMPQVSTIIFLSPMRDSRVRQLVKEIFERRKRVLALIPGYSANKLKISGSDPASVVVAKRIAQLERENAFRFLTRIGIPTIEWDPGLPLSITMEAFERWQGRIPMASS
jgi:uncharacterized protein (DUF58 family)